MTVGKLTNPSVIRELLNSLGHRPNKGLGQNYLIDGNILGIIVDAAEISENDRLLEIGPGLGALTQALLATGAPLTAIEKDPAMVAHLKRTFQGLELREDDVLNVDLEALFVDGVNRIVANLPYSVGSRFIVNALEARPLPEKMVFMVQKEVADRLTAQPGGKAYGPLAIWSQLNYDVKNIKNVSPKCFMPAPKVWSAVVRFEKRETPLADLADYSAFKRLVKTAFTQRRKQIGSNLRKNLPEFFQGLENAGIDPAIRPEQISIQQWVSLANCSV
ncbi:16S rRNA (adenine(1518)-N(6)/adenine(1519)-N(6))-dimethyltransferase RsmA [Tichowtungia aerotolerans]|uniref:Ribosomal RNA small subunit methyltransferase A n=1 Tax=Tichowtungia aerotolerans TaxID=2697043 RepID=A0A6P1M9M4_9BACT|nr:16S rRNA (adenine(1518)-N(6)/adenine(1519)-N(6))-dimethyltransferase RsmA [Tichowtungia aerotolerans]QHI68286.1 ribosomal RNA small subunit methyltransferase A [Tichowtungia aerotolerans]